MTIDEILEYLLTGIPDHYDISVGSFFHDILYPVAVQIYLLQNKINGLSENVFALTADGEYLDRKAAEQGLTRKSATYAKGTVKISGSRGDIVPMGAKLAADTLLFAVDETVIIPECGYVEVTATCLTAGSVGNVKKSEINRFPVTLPGLTSVTNTTNFTGGYDEESDDDLRERYFEKVSRPNVSGNKYNYIEWAKEVVGVGDVQVIPLWSGAGTVKVVVVDLDNQPASAELIDSVKAHVEEKRPIGANVTVVSAKALMVNISVKLAMTSDIDVSEKIKTSIKKYLSTIALSQSYISYAKIGSLILSIDGVDDYAELKVNNGIVNINISDGYVPVLGNVVIS